MTAAIFYDPDAYTTRGRKVMGRNVAGESFLRGFALHGRTAEFWTLVDSADNGARFTQTLRDYGRGEPVHVIDNRSLHRLKQAGTLHYPTPQIGPLAYRRAAFGQRAWSLCGITHTTSSTGAMDGISELLTAPVQPWDALICTSTAVHDAVSRLLRAQYEYLHERLGVARMVLPQLPVIPLGVNTADFAFSAAQRAAARAALGVDADTIVVLFLGRLSFHAKAHPLPMYLALEKAARASGKQVLLVECGRHASAQIAAAFTEAAQLACPSVRALTLDSGSADKRQQAWAAADIFSSLSDNIQESFGLTPVEAMASGLPLVVSDWNGYKDTVRDTVERFRIPTLMPQAGLGADLALRHALDVDSYDRYCGYTSITVAVDVDAAARAFVELFANPALRRQMGEAARRRARQTYDWAAIIPQYEALWAELADMRLAAPDRKRAQAWAARPDPFHLYAAYPTRVLQPQTLLRLIDADAESALQRALAYRQLAMVSFAQRILPTDAEIGVVLAAAAPGEKSAAELVQGIAPERRPLVLRSLAWLVKMNILALANEASPQ